MLVEVKEGRKWVPKKMSAWEIEVKHRGKWVLLALLNNKETRKRASRPRRRDRLEYYPRYCMWCHCSRKDTPCVKCGKPTLLHEQMNQVPADAGGSKHGHFFVQAGRFESNPRRF
jgi:hypothetical protein